MKNIKKIFLSTLLSLTMLLYASLGMMLPAAAYADDSALTLAAGNVSGNAGSVIEVPVSLSSSGEVGGIQFDLSYDDTLLTYQTVDGISPGTLTPGFTVTTNAQAADKQRVIIFNPSGTAIAGGNGTVAVLKFQVAAGAQGNQACTLALSGVKLSDTSGDRLAVTPVTTNGQFTASQAESGDSADATLSALTLSEGTLSPAFAAETLAYTVNVANNVTSITVTPTVNESYATVTVNGASAETPVALNVGTNTINVVVTAQDGTTTQTYTITVTREGTAISNEANLSALTVSSGALSPAFAAETQAYTVTVANNVSSITVTPTAANSGATITVNGSAVSSGQASDSFALTLGANTIQIEVKAADKNTTKVYTLVIIRPSNPGSMWGVDTGCIATILRGGSSYSGDGGPVADALIRYASSFLVDSAGNIYIAGSSPAGANLVLMISATDSTKFGINMAAGYIYKIAGTGDAGYGGDGGPGTGAQLNAPSDIALDNAGNLYIADRSNSRIRKVDPSGIISTVIGTGTAGSSGDNGPAVDATINKPSCLAVDSSGNLFLGETGRVRVVPADDCTLFGVNMKKDYIYTVAGDGTNVYSGYDVPAIDAQITNPYGFAFDASGNLYIASSKRIYAIAAVSGKYYGVNMTAGNIYTVVGTGISDYNGDDKAAFMANTWGYGVAIDKDGNLFIADNKNYRIRMVDSSGIITTVAGTGTQGYSGEGGPAAAANLAAVTNVATDANGNLYFIDYSSNKSLRYMQRQVVTSKPVPSPAAGAVNVNTMVSLSSPTDGATIYYTTNGDTPTTASTSYTEPLVIDTDKTIKAIAVKEGMPNNGVSGVMTAAYTLATVATPVPNPAAGAVALNTPITLTSATDDATIYYTTNGDEPTTASTPYTEPLVIDANKTIKAIAVKAGWPNSNVLTAAYTLAPVATPVANPAAGAVEWNAQITLTSATDGATIYYTTNGDEPTISSTRYTEPLVIDANKTIKAIAVKDGWPDSKVLTAAYMISVATPVASPAPGDTDLTTTVTLTSATYGAVIYYTTNGDTPTTDSIQYTAPIKLDGAKTIKAIAVLPGLGVSSVLTADYSIGGTATPVASPGAGEIPRGTLVTLTSATPGAAIYYTTNGDTPTTDSTLYTVPIKINSPLTIKAVAVAANKQYSAMLTANYVNSVATPTASLETLSVDMNSPLTLSTTTAGASIFYTMDGTTPSATNGTLYAEPIIINEAMTVKAIAVQAGMDDSDILTMTYTIAAVRTPEVSVTVIDNHPTLLKSAEKGQVNLHTLISFSSGTAGASIYYTTDGTNPSVDNGTLFTTPIDIVENMTLKAIAVLAGAPDSELFARDYTLMGFTVGDISPAATLQASGKPYEKIYSFDNLVNPVGGSLRWWIEGKMNMTPSYKNSNGFQLFLKDAAGTLTQVPIDPSELYWKTDNKNYLEFFGWSLQYGKDYVIKFGPAITNPSAIRMLYDYSFEFTTISHTSPGLTVDSTDNFAGQPIKITFSDDPDWRAAITGVTVDGTPLIPTTQYTVSAGVLEILPGVLAAGEHSIVVKADGYTDATVSQNIEAAKLPLYNLSPVVDAAYTNGENEYGIHTMTVNADVTGLNYFRINIAPVVEHIGDETVIFVRLRNGIQLELNALKADFDSVNTAVSGFNVRPGDVVKVYIVDELTNSFDFNPTFFQ